MRKSEQRSCYLPFCLSYGLLISQHGQGFLVEAFMFFIFIQVMFLQEVIWIWGTLAPLQAFNPAVDFSDVKPPLGNFNPYFDQENIFG